MQQTGYIKSYASVPPRKPVETRLPPRRSKLRLLRQLQRRIYGRGLALVLIANLGPRGLPRGSASSPQPAAVAAFAVSMVVRDPGKSACSPLLGRFLFEKFDLEET